MMTYKATIRTHFLIIWFIGHITSNPTILFIHGNPTSEWIRVSSDLQHRFTLVGSVIKSLSASFLLPKLKSLNTGHRQFKLLCS